MRRGHLLVLFAALALPFVVQSQTGFEETFDAPVDLTFWRPHTGLLPDGTPMFDVSQDDSTLKVVMKQNVFSDGQFYNFGNIGMIFDLTVNPWASFKIRIAPGVIWGTKTVKTVSVSLSPWDKLPDAGGLRQHTNKTFSVKADSTWREYTFDWSAPDANPVENPNDYSMITAFLLETVQWPDPYQATFWIDDFRIGDKVVFTSVRDNASLALPNGFALSQNFPNPFNPTTRIFFQVPKESHVHLAVYDLAGREVATLADGKQTAGLHEVRVDASLWPSGVYLVRLDADGFSQIRRMVLMK